MTVADIPARQRYAGNGITINFSTVFTFLANSHVRVIHTFTDGTERELVENYDYTLVGANTNSPGVVTTVSGVVPMGAYLTIMRNVPFTQTFNGTVLSTADAEDLEFSYDKIWQGMQQLNEAVSRTLQSSPGGPYLEPVINGFVPVFAIEEHENIHDPSLPFRCVVRIVDWTGGHGEKPQTGLYIGPTSLVAGHWEAVDIRGGTGPVGPGSGDMLATNNLSDVGNKITAGDNLSIFGADVPSAATINLNTANGNAVTITGTSTITKLLLNAGNRRLVRFADALILTHNADIRLPGYFSIVTALDDWALFIGNPDGTVSCAAYLRSSGKPLVNPAIADLGLGTAATHPDTDFLQTANNLDDVPDKVAAIDNLGLGTAAVQNVGVAAGNVVQLTTANTLPSLDGSALINLPPAATSGQPIPTSSVYAIGTFMLLIVTTGNVANGGTVSGAAIALPVWVQNAATGALFYGMAPGASPTGTWMNVSGASIGATSSTFAGYFVRTA